MSIATFVFQEATPSAPGTARSSQPVQSAANSLPAGVAGPLQDFEAVNVIAEITAGTGGTLDVYVQTSPDGGVTWYDIVHFPQAAGGSGTKIYTAPISNATATANTVQVGKNLSPALGTSPNVVNGAFSDRMSLVFVAGSGTSVAGSVKCTIQPQKSEATRG